MTDRTAPTQATPETKRDFSISGSDRQILRRLAGRVADIAVREIESEKRDLWYRHNALQPTRPVVFCDPENGWNEIILEHELGCSNPLAREWERRLRREVFWGDSMGDDRVVELVFPLSYIAEESDWGMRETKIGGEDGGAYAWDAPLKSYEDLDKLRFPVISVDYAATETLVELAGDILGDLLKVELRGSWWWTLGETQVGIGLRGLEGMMLDMCLEPDGLKGLMGILRDGTLAKLDFLEKNGLLSLNNGGTYVGSGGFGYTHDLPQSDFDGERVRTCDMWGFAESQETAQVSPAHFAEFVFPYQLPVLDRFGLNCYGCCEALDGRWSIVKEIPRLRRVSISPWSNLEVMAENLQDRFIFSMKPSPTPLASSSLDEDFIRKALRWALQVTRDCRVEVIMKDNHTIGGNPENVIRWCRIAREEAEAL